MSRYREVLDGCKLCGKRMLTRGSILIHRTCDTCKAEQRRERARKTAERRKAERHAAKAALPVPRCEQCHEPIEQPMRLHSRDRYDTRWARRFCSNACRQAAHRDRVAFPSP